MMALLCRGTVAAGCFGTAEEELSPSPLGQQPALVQLEWGRALQQRG